MARTPIQFEGNLSRDVKLGETNAGKPYAEFGVAEEHRVRDEAAPGGWRDGNTEFHNVKVFGKLAERLADTLQKGDRVVVAGDLVTQQYEGRDGESRTGVQVQATSVGVSPRFENIAIDRSHRRSATAESTGPVAQPAQAQHGFGAGMN